MSKERKAKHHVDGSKNNVAVRAFAFNPVGMADAGGVHRWRLSYRKETVHMQPEMVR